MLNLKHILSTSLMLTFVSTVYAQRVNVEFYTPSTVRIVKAAPGQEAAAAIAGKQSLTVIAAPEKVKVSKKTVGETTTYSTSRLTVKVEGDRVTFLTPKGKVLTSEGATAFTTINDGPDKGSWKVKQEFGVDGDEGIYGVGMLQNGKMSQRGENRRMEQTNLEDYAHFYQTIKGYGIFWDNYSPTVIVTPEKGEKGNVSMESEVGKLVDYYFMYGGDADGVIKEMRHISGKVPMLPLWTYGFHQSRERYKSSKELLDVVDTYQKTGVPLDGIIQDWQYWGNNYLWNAMEFLNEDFKDYKGMIKHVHDLKKHMTISIWASFGPYTKGYRQLEEKNLLYDFETWPQSGLGAWPPNMDYPSGVRVYDSFSKDARNIYWQNLSRLHSAGIDAWWMDSTDPDHHSYKDSDLDQVLPFTNPVTGDNVMASYRSVRNAFPLCTVEGVYDSQRAVDSNKRVFILTRSYFAGQQRTGANTWSGDVSSSWDSFRKQVPICLNYTLTANPNVNSDIGGFFANAYNKSWADNTATKNPLFQELYVRWMQFGLFCPMMRSHGTEVYREIYYYGKPGEPVYDALLSAIKMRYELLPYIYSQSWQVSRNDDSFMRALVMDFPGDKAVADNNREYMFGNAFLVAPVVNALYTPETANQTDEISGWNRNNKGLYQEGYTVDWNEKKTYDVYLPEGSKWYDYWTGALLDGGQTVKAAAPIAHSPLYVKAGSIVPLCKANVDHADVADWKSLDIVVYPGKDADFTLYEDEGDNYNYEKGAYSTINFHWNDKAGTLTIGKRQGAFSGMVAERNFNVKVIGKETKSVAYVGKAVSCRVK